MRTAFERLLRADLAKVYLVVALAWGVALVAIVPPLQTFDELAHYYRAWSVAEGQLIAPSDGTVFLPRSAALLPAEFPYAPIAMHQARFQYSRIPRLIWQPIAGPDTASLSFASSYGPLGYVPQTAGILVAKALRHSPLLGLYLGRLFNLLVAVLLVFLGLRLLPYGRPILLVLALLPMTMMEMTSLSPDALLLSGSFFFVALALNLARRTRLDWRHAVVLCLSASLLLNAKPGFVALALVALVIPWSAFESRRLYAIAMSATIVGAGLVAGAILLGTPSQQDVLVQMVGPNSGIDPTAQITYVLHHPVGFARALLATLNTLGLFLARQSVAAFAWGQLNINDTFAVAGWIAVVAVFFLREKVGIRAWQRLVLMASAFACALSVATGLYVSWTPVGLQSVQGLQGRYFVPCVFAGLLGLFGFPFSRRWVVGVVVGLCILLLIAATLRTLVVYYY